MKIYVGNLAYNATKGQLREIISAYGDIANANLIKDRFTGQSKGLGFIKVAKSAEAETAINTQNNTVLIERNFTVHKAKPRAGVPSHDYRH
jgi:RNA recognition motif-containing protein